MNLTLVLSLLSDIKNNHVTPITEVTVKVRSIEFCSNHTYYTWNVVLNKFKAIESIKETGSKTIVINKH